MCVCIFYSLSLIKIKCVYVCVYVYVCCVCLYVNQLHHTLLQLQHSFLWQFERERTTFWKECYERLTYTHIACTHIHNTHTHTPSRTVPVLYTQAFFLYVFKQFFEELCASEKVLNFSVCVCVCECECV